MIRGYANAKGLIVGGPYWYVGANVKRLPRFTRLEIVLVGGNYISSVTRIRFNRTGARERA